MADAEAPPASFAGAPLGPRLSKSDKRKSVIALCVFWFFTGVEYAVILPSAWEYLQRLGAETQFWMSASVAAFSVANFILSPFYGRAADSMSIKKILLFSNVWELAGNALYLFANDVYTAVEARFIAGMGAAAGVCVFAYVAHISDTPQELNALMGLVMASRAIGLLMGPAFNVLVVNMDFTVAGFHVDKLNGPGLLMVIVWFLCQLVLLFFFKDVPRPKKGQRLTPEHPRSPTPSIQGSDDVPEEPISWREYLNFPVVAVVTLQFIQMFNQTAYETWLTPFTNVVFVFNQLENSIVYMSTAVIGLFTWFLILCFTKRRPISDRVQLTFGMFLQLGGFLIFWLLPAANRKQLWKFAVASVTFVVGLPFVYVAPALQAKLTTQRTQGRGQGVRRSAVSLAQVVGPLWSSLADVPVRFWGGMVGFTGLGILIIAAAWRQLWTPSSGVQSGDEETQSLLSPEARSRTSTVHGSYNTINGPTPPVARPMRNVMDADGASSVPLSE